MKKLTGPIAGMMEAFVANFAETQAKHVADSHSKYGICEKPGFFIPFISPKRMAAQFETNIKTLERLRKTGEGPPWVKWGNKRIRYSVKLLDAWIDEQLKLAGFDSE